MIDIETIQTLTIARLAGVIDSKTAPSFEAEILPSLTAGTDVILNLSRVPFLSSAGLRFLLLVYRQVTGAGGKSALCSVAPEIRSTMSYTGFEKFFAFHDTEEEAIAALQA
jgi:anti-sigma B factor antagonist